MRRRVFWRGAQNSSVGSSSSGSWSRQTGRHKRRLLVRSLLRKAHKHSHRQQLTSRLGGVNHKPNWSKKQILSSSSVGDDDNDDGGQSHSAHLQAAGTVAIKRRLRDIRREESHISLVGAII